MVLAESFISGSAGNREREILALAGAFKTLMPTPRDTLSLTSANLPNKDTPHNTVTFTSIWGPFVLKPPGSAPPVLHRLVAILLYKNTCSSAPEVSVVYGSLNTLKSSLF